VEAHDPSTAPPKNGESLRISVVSTAGGEPRRLPSGDVFSLDWSPHGDEIVYGSGSGAQRIIRADGSKPRPFFPRPQTRGLGLPAWSPDGAHVGFIGFGGVVRRGRFADRYAGIYVADADGSKLHLVTSHAYEMRQRSVVIECPTAPFRRRPRGVRPCSGMPPEPLRAVRFCSSDR
jgi:hypothetical protein